MPLTGGRCGAAGVLKRGEFGRMFVGTYSNKLDRKGRVSVPAEFRALLKADGWEGAVLFPNLFHQAVEGGTGSYLDAMLAEWDGLPEVEREDRTMALVPNVRRLEWDEGGRIVLPEEMIAHAGLTETVVFTGMRKSFMLWSPEGWAERQAQAAARAREARVGRPQ